MTAPKRDTKFKKGQIANPKGKPKGTPNGITADIKKMVKEALGKAGGVDYLLTQAHENPKAFLTLVAKLMPQEANINLKVDPAMADILTQRRDAIAAKREEMMKVIEHEQAAE